MLLADVDVNVVAVIVGVDAAVEAAAATADVADSMMMMMLIELLQMDVEYSNVVELFGMNSILTSSLGKKERFVNYREVSKLDEL